MKTQSILAASALALAAMLTASADTHNVAAGATETLSGVTETSATVKTGSGTLVFTGNNTLLRFQPQAGAVKFSGGTTTIGDSTATGTTAATAPWGQTGGETVVTDGATVKVTAGKYFIMDDGTLQIENGTLDVSGPDHFMNAFESGNTSTGSKIVIGNGGVLKAGSLRPSGDGANAASFKEKVGIDLNAGGELRIGQFWADQNANRYGRINFNGGVLYPQWGPTVAQTGNYLFNNDTVTARRPWTQDQITPTILEGGAYIDLSVGNNYVQKSFASGAEHDGGLHIRGTKILYWNAKNSSFNGGTWLEGNGGIFVVDASKGDDTVFGASPVAPQDNIFITGANHTLFSQSGKFEVGANRNVSVKDGVRFRVAGNENSPLVLHGEIHGEVANGATYPTGTALHIRGDWNGPVVLDPGANRTNDIGRLVNLGRLEIASGVTRVVSSTTSGTTEANALVFASGNGSSFSDARTLAVNGGTLVAPDFNANRFVVAEKYASVAVSNGGVIDMPYTEYVNGLNSPARLSIENGTVRVKNFQLANGTQSEVNFGKDGMLEITGNNLRKYGTGTATLNFDGGGIRASGAADITLDSSSATSVQGCTFNILAGGAVLDADKKNIWIKVPLQSAAESDGGLVKKGSNILVFATNCTYNGTTRIEEGSFQSRVDEGLLPGSTLALANGANANFCKYDGSSNWTSTRTVQHLGRLEGNGRVSYSRYLHVDGAVAPSIGGSLKLQEQCDLQGDLEIRGDETGCGQLEALTDVSYAIDISNLRVKMIDPDNFDKAAEPGFYKILEAPNGITGRFVEPADVPDGWHVKYAADRKSAYLHHVQPLVMVIR